MQLVVLGHPRALYAPSIGHDHHHHHARSEAERSRLAVALALIVAFMAGEVVAAILSGSLALLSDAAHMLTDAGALALSLVAARLTARPAKGAMTYGLGRAEILSAQANGVTLLVLALLLVYGGVRRLISPPDVDGTVVVVVAVVGIVVNLAATRALEAPGERSMNVEGAYRHLVTDLFAFVATAISGVVVLTSGADRADAIASLLIAAVMIHSSWGLIRSSARVFLEAAPEDVDPNEIGRALAAEEGVVEVHDLHVWEVTSGFPALSAHVIVAPDDDCHATRRRLSTLLRGRFGLEHTTLQVEHAPRDEQLVRIEGAANTDERTA